MRLLASLLEQFDTALEWDAEDPLLADHQVPDAVTDGWAAPSRSDLCRTA